MATCQPWLDLLLGDTLLWSVWNLHFYPTSFWQPHLARSRSHPLRIECEAGMPANQPLSPHLIGQIHRWRSLKMTGVGNLKPGAYEALY